MESFLTSIKEQDASKFIDGLLAIWLESDNAVSSSNSDLVKSLSEMKEFLTKATTQLNGKITVENKKLPTLNDQEIGDTIMEFPDLQLLEPRGRFKVTITSKGFLIDGKSGGGFIDYLDMNNIILVPSHTSSKKEGEDYLAVIFNRTLKICGKDTKNILFNLCKTLPKQPKVSASTENAIEIIDTPLTESEKVIQAIRKGTNLKIQRPDGRLFRSIGNNSKSFLRCHKGTQEGAIYPLECGIMFIKPLLFIPADEMASLSAGRGGGSGNTRFVDLKIETSEDKIIEFVNIEREELPALQLYVAGYLELRKAKQGKSIEMNQNVNLTAADDSEDEDDDYNPDESNSDDSGDDEDGGSGSVESDSDEDDQRKKSSKKRKNKEVTRKVKKEIPAKKAKVERDHEEEVEVVEVKVEKVPSLKIKEESVQEVISL